MSVKETEENGKGNPPLALIAGVAGWFVPGLGHVVLRKWAKAVAYFVAVAALAIIGLLSRGNVFSYGGDALDRLGFLADLGCGIFYFLSGKIGAGPDVSHAAGDYGTRFIATAGVLNLLCVLEAVHTALGHVADSKPSETPGPEELSG